MIYLLAALAAIVAVAWWVVRRSADSPERLPGELLGARLRWSEQEFRCLDPVPMVARMDRAYQAAGKELTLIEFKRRSQVRAYPSDMVELSSQRYVLERNGHP